MTLFQLFFGFILSFENLNFLEVSFILWCFCSFYLRKATTCLDLILLSTQGPDKVLFFSFNLTCYFTLLSTSGIVACLVTQAFPRFVLTYSGSSRHLNHPADNLLWGPFWGNLPALPLSHQRSRWMMLTH